MAGRRARGRAILAGDDRTGVCLMAVDEGLDTGPVYARVETPILAEETAAELRATPGAISATILLVERLGGGAVDARNAGACR